VPQISELLAPGREGGTFYLADGFSSRLATARREHAGAGADAQREQRRLADALTPVVGRLPESHEFILMRDVLPGVPPGVRVVRETPAYRLVTLELDDAALAAAERLDAALGRVAREEDLVRRELAAGVAQHGPRLLEAAGSLGELDRTLARVAFTQRWGGCVPAPSEDRFAFEGASFVPLRAALAEAGLPYTPISVDLRGVAVLTGPNMGGKSAALATCGFLAACVAAGVPPPAEHAALPLFASVAWIGADSGAADRARLLSAFGGEVVRTREALVTAEPPALLLVDEFARTTGPREGRALLVALVEDLARRGAFALIATHFDAVARAAGVPHLTIAGLGDRSLDVHGVRGMTIERDIHAALDAVARAMDYRIIAVDGARPARSDALALAALLGLDAAIVERAAALFAE
jgi:DNA mismatch repair ATPase MutS